MNNPSNSISLLKALLNGHAGMTRNIYHQLIAHSSDSSLPVLATVIRTSGSTPQKPGSSALFLGSKLVAGTVGGGAVEGKITEVASERSHSGISGLMSFDLVADISRKEEAICGGNISILIDANPLKHAEVFRNIEQSLSLSQPGVLITMIEGSDNSDVAVERYWVTADMELPSKLLHAGQVARDILLKTDPDPRSMDINPEGRPGMLYFEPVFPPPELVIAGAGHIGRALSHLGAMTGFEVTVVDDRSEFANSENLPDAHRIIVKDIGEAVREIRKGPETYIVIVTRGHKDDAEALRSCISSGPGYLGMIGSRRKIDAIKKEFIEKRWATEEQWNRVYTPIGLEINSQTIEEIAVSIIAQVIKVKNGSRQKKSSCPA
jgi:xanthine dehydrogenase accessory factor